MREILFKAKRIDNGEWVEGYIYKIQNIFLIFPQITNGSYDVSRKVMKFINPCFEINPETICQYTGLTDKNGNKIWENDVCARRERFPEIVKQHKGDWTLDYSYACKKEYGYNYCNLGFYVCDRPCVEVIGNIFDNPELLENE